MAEKTLIILTHHFPVEPGEEFLIDELEIIAPYFSRIIIYPINVKNGSKSLHQLPLNVNVLDSYDPNFKYLNIDIAAKLIRILLNEFISIPSKKLFFSFLKFNLSLLKQCYIKAVRLTKSINNSGKTIIYTYWCDDLALTGAFCKLLKPEIGFVSRAHGFDVFEEQSDIKYIFFRSFQLENLDKIWVVSKKGSEHLKKKNKRFQSKIDCSYLGIQSDEKIHFEKIDTIRLATCSRIRSIKRLELLIESLRLLKDRQVEWHVIGDGEDLDKLKKRALLLPDNCRVIFHGFLTTNQLHAFYGETHLDFLVSLSSSEGLPVSMMEATSHGIPVLSTDVGGCNEIVNERTGILIPADFSPNTLTGIIENCKREKFNNLEQRKDILSFWKSNFYSKTNYEKFAKNLLELKTTY